MLKSRILAGLGTSAMALLLATGAASAQSTTLTL